MMSEGKKRVLFLVSTLSTGGAQRAFANMSLGFPDNWECDFLLNDTENITYPYKGNVIDIGLKAQEDKTKLLYQLKVFIKRYYMLRELKGSGKYTACISALTSANAVNIFVRNRNCKTIISIRIFMSRTLQEESGFKNRIKRWVIENLSNKADYVVAVSESMRNDLVQNFGVEPQKTVTIYNGYIPEKMNKLAEEKLTEKESEWFQYGKKYIITVGRLDRQKGQIHLLRAFQQIKKNCPDACLLILGEGELREELEKLIYELGLKGSVTLCGFVENPYKFVKRSDLFVLPSLFEGFPNTLAESLCLGTPVVATDCDSGVREILAPDTDVRQKTEDKFELAEYGILCPVCRENVQYMKGSILKEEHILADAVIYMLQDGEIYQHYKRKSRERAEQLKIENSIQRWIELMENRYE